MKKIRIALFCLSVTVLGVSAQNAPSGSISCSTDSATLDNLEVLCKVWGYVKYHHPVFADSKVDADSALFALLSRTAPATPRRRNEILKDWIDKLGPFTINRQHYRRMLDTLDCDSIVDLNWIEDKKSLGKDLSRTLKDLRYAKRDSNRYVSYVFPNGNLKFDREINYPDTTDCRYRLLSLFRYWNIIEYFFPYKPLMDKPWDSVLRDYLPEFIHPEHDNYFGLVCRLSTSLNDYHALTGGAFDWRRARIDLGVVENKLVVLSSDKLTENGEKYLAPGDEIVTIDGKPIDSVRKKLSKYLAHSNPAGANYLLGNFALRSNSPFSRNPTSVNSVRIGYLRDSILKDTIVRIDAKKIIPNIKKPPYEVIGDSVGYIYAGKFDDKNIEDLIDKLKDTKGIIVDLRCYPSAFMVYPFIHVWLLEHNTPVAVFSNPLITLPGYFAKKTESFGAGMSDSCYKGKIIVLVNEQTVSQAEYTTMTLQANPRTTVIGSQTLGADGNISRVPFLGMLFSNFSGLGVYYPDGGQTQRIGVRIDKVVEPTIEGIKAGRDEVLERAIEIIGRTAAEK